MEEDDNGANTDKNNAPGGIKKHDTDTAADLERVTDYAEEKEIKVNLENAFQVIGEKRKQEQLEKARRDQELSKVKVNKDDIELIVNEMEIPRTLAEKKLRECGGDVVKALSVLVNG